MKQIILSHVFHTIIAIVALMGIFALLQWYGHGETNDRIIDTGEYAFFVLWIKFFAIYLINMAILYYGSQTLGLWRFIRFLTPSPALPDQIQKAIQHIRNARSSMEIFRPTGKILLLIFRKLGIALLWALVFTPSYVAAYTVKSVVNTESLFFMMGLGCLTNGILVLYAQKFFTLLLTEYRKGYTETAQVADILWEFIPGVTHGIRWSDLLGWPKHLGNHPLEAIYQNARYQYLSSFREQAAFLITCMMMIEMALNIHGFLGYELLRSLLLRNYLYAGWMMAGLFLIVKLTEIGTEYLLYIEKRKRAND